MTTKKLEIEIDDSTRAIIVTEVGSDRDDDRKRGISFGAYVKWPGREDLERVDLVDLAPEIEFDLTEGLEGSAPWLKNPLSILDRLLNFLVNLVRTYLKD